MVSTTVLPVIGWGIPLAALQPGKPGLPSQQFPALSIIAGRILVFQSAG